MHFSVIIVCETCVTKLTLVWFFFVVDCLLMDFHSTSMSERFFTEPTVMWFFFEMNRRLGLSSVTR